MHVMVLFDFPRTAVTHGEGWENKRCLFPKGVERSRGAQSLSRSHIPRPLSRLFPPHPHFLRIINNFIHIICKSSRPSSRPFRPLGHLPRSIRTVADQVLPVESVTARLRHHCLISPCPLAINRRPALSNTTPTHIQDGSHHRYQEDHFRREEDFVAPDLPVDDPGESASPFRAPNIGLPSQFVRSSGIGRRAWIMDRAMRASLALHRQAGPPEVQLEPAWATPSSSVEGGEWPRRQGSSAYQSLSPLFGRSHPRFPTTTTKPSPLAVRGIRLRGWPPPSTPDALSTVGRRQGPNRCAARRPSNLSPRL